MVEFKLILLSGVTQFTNVNILLSFLVITLLGVIRHLYNDNKSKSNQHLEDIKLFDAENKKSNKDLLDILNKFYLSLEENKISDKGMLDKLNEVISLIKEKLNG